MSNQAKAVVSLLVALLGIAGAIAVLADLGVPDPQAVLTQAALPITAQATPSPILYTPSLSAQPSRTPTATPTPSAVPTPTAVRTPLPITVTPIQVPGQSEKLYFFDEAYFTPNRTMNRRPCAQTSSACPPNGSISGKARVFCLIELTVGGDLWLGLTPMCESGDVVAYRLAGVSYGTLVSTTYPAPTCEFGAPLEDAFVRAATALAVRPGPEITLRPAATLPVHEWVRAFCIYEPQAGQRWVRVRDGWLTAIWNGTVLAEVLW
jgi:hypothetical protein